jgi:hypothetical protein
MLPPISGGLLWAAGKLADWAIRLGLEPVPEVVRIAYGPAFITPADDDEAFLANLSTMTRRYLFRL